MWEDLVIGIDFGTTNCCVSVFENGRIKVIVNTNDDRITPSYLFFGDEIFVGKHAKNMALSQPKNGIYEMKRLVGRKFDDPYLQNLLKYVAYEVTPNANNDPIVNIQQNRNVIKKTVVELCCILFEHLKKLVDDEYGECISKTVVTVPAYFDTQQRQAILQAAKDAGFSVLKLLNEPTAAALCYNFEQGGAKSGTSYSLVYDLGGGTFDVAVIKKSLNDINIISVDGDPQLGGHDFDNLIKDYVCDEVMANYGFDLRKKKKDMARLHIKCEDAKHALSTTKEQEIELIAFVEGQDFVRIKLTRQKFEQLANDLFEKTIRIVEKCLKNCNIDKDLIQEVILVGGSTRIPKIQEKLKQFFGEKRLRKLINPDEAVARGAAIQAAMLSKHPSQKIKLIKLADVIPLSIGLADFVGRMEFLIKRNTPIPYTATKTFITTYHNQPKVELKVYEGERLDVRKNRCIASLEISNITLAPAGECEIVFRVEANENGTLSFKAEEKFKNNLKYLLVNNVRGDKSDFEIKSKIKNAEKMETEDRKFVKTAKARAYLFEYCSAIIENLTKRGIADRFPTIVKMCKEYKIKALTKYNDKSFSHVEDIIKKVKEKCEILVLRYRFENMPRSSGGF